jgi:hypothetical protein
MSCVHPHACVGEDLCVGEERDGEVRHHVVHSRYTQGTLKVHSRYTQGTLKVHSRYTQGTLHVHSRYTQGTVKVQSRYNQGTFKVHSRYTRGTLKVHSRYTQGKASRDTTIMPLICPVPASFQPVPSANPKTYLYTLETYFIYPQKVAQNTPSNPTLYTLETYIPAAPQNRNIFLLRSIKPTSNLLYIPVKPTLCTLKPFFIYP